MSTCTHSHHEYHGPSPATGPAYAGWDGLEAFVAGHEHAHDHVEALAWQDPTGQETRYNKYAQNLRGALERIRAAARAGIVDKDVFGLENEALVSPPDSFDFELDADKEEAFREWFEQQVERDILVEHGAENVYIRNAYLRALEETDTDLRQAGVADPDDITEAVVHVGVHRDQVQELFTRNFRALEGMTDATAAQLSRELSDGLAGGENPLEIARRIDDRIEKVGKKRATTIARTEVMNSHVRAATTRYEQFGVELVEPLLDPGACEICVGLKQDAPFEVAEARSKYPAHPQCRCGLTVWTGENN